MNVFVVNTLCLTVLIPSAILCYLPMHRQLRFRLWQIILVCVLGLGLYIPLAGWVTAHFDIHINTVLLPTLAVFYLLYNMSVKAGVSKTLCIFVSACALMTFPTMFGFAWDAYRNPTGSYDEYSLAAAVFQVSVTAALALLLGLPFHKYYGWLINRVNLARVWNSFTAVSLIIAVFNIYTTPDSYTILQTDGLFSFYMFFEISLLLLLLYLHWMFYHIARVFHDNARLEQRSRLLGIQASQYEALKNHMQQNARLRHDFRHSIHAMAALANESDLDSLKAHLETYGQALDVGAPVSFVENSAVNAVLNYYYELALSAEIKTDWRIQLPDTLRLSELDMCSLLGNIIEDAISGCKTIPAEKRYHNLSIELKNKDRLYIVSTNSFDGYVRKRGGKYLSTKGHGSGMGLASAKSIAEKYNGQARFSNSDSEFFIDLMLRV